MSSKPTIDINAGREEIAKFIKENKVPIKVTEVVDGKKKKRGVKALREDLSNLGYAVTGKKKPKGRAPTTLKGMRKAQERKEEKGIQIQGFSSETKPPAPQVSGQEVELMGAISGKLSAEQEVIYKNLPPAEDMRLFLLTRLPRTTWAGIPLRELKLLYMKEKAEENEQLFAPQYKDLPPLPEIKSYLREQLPSVNIDNLTLVGIKELYIKTKPKVDEALRIKAEEEEERQYQQAIADREAKEKAEDTDTDTDEEIEGVDLLSYEGVLYQVFADDPDDIYDMRGNYVGRFDEDFIDIQFINDEFKLQHEKDVDDYQMDAYKPPPRKKPIRREKSKAEEPEPEEEELTEEEVDTLLDLVGDTSKFYRERLQAWENLRDAGINISKPTRQPATPVNPRPETETLDTDDDTDDEEPEADTTSEEELGPDDYIDFRYEGVQYSYQDGMVYDEFLDAIGEAKIKNRMFIKWDEAVQEYHRRKVAAMADPDNEDDGVDKSDLWKFSGDLEDFVDDL